MPEVITYNGAPQDEAEAVGRVVEQVRHWEENMGRDFRLKCLRLYKQYRGFRQFRDAWLQSSPKDRDGMIYDAKKHWGAHLHIPMSFRTIETIVPRAIAQMPKLLVLPREEQWVRNVEAIRLLLDAQQQQINIDLPFQEVMRSGRIYGLGVGKTYWRTEYRSRRQVVKKALGGGFGLSKEPVTQLVFDDPMFEAVDIFDFMWDPYASDLETAEWVVHRCWLSTRAVMERLQQGVWATESAKLLDDEEDVKALGGGASQHYDEIWRERLLASGFSAFNFTHRGEMPHELLEYHDGDRVVSVLDRQVLVQDMESPCAGRLPFQIYRPTPVAKQFVGIGDLEPLEHLQRELDTLRSQRRDAATIALNAGYAFDDGAIDEDDLVFGPGAAIRVTNGRPADALMPIPTKQVPGTAYQDEQVLRSDIEAVSGMQDTLQNPQAGGGSATEAQLAHATLGQRIMLSARRFEIEVVREVARTMLYLDQRMILEKRPSLRVPDDQLDSLEAAETGRWKWFEIGPGQLMGEYEIEAEGGSMAARNIPQDRADAAQFMNLFRGNWFINPTKTVLKALELMGVKNPQSWLRDPEPSIPAVTLQLLRNAGVDPALLQQAVIAGRTLAAPHEGGEGVSGEQQAPMATSQAPAGPSPYGG